MSRTEHLHSFSAYGIEFEYMIVDRQNLAVRPICDEVLKSIAGEETGEVEVADDLEWSNELVAHVIEVKTAGPTADLNGLASRLQKSIESINRILSKHGAMLLPTAMHPLMLPHRDLQLYPYGDGKDVYEAYHRVFDCRGHGWSNLQSVHINFPFFDDAEFSRLHAAIRLVLPILPALAASSPIYEGKLSGLADSRLEFYRHNQKRVPEITGKVIPERAFSRKEYDELILRKVYAAIAPFDPDGSLRYEWLNSRGAIARFDRHAIEIRVLDIQESPKCDLAIVSLVIGLVKACYEGLWVDNEIQKQFHEDDLLPIFIGCTQRGEKSVIGDKDYLSAFGWKGGAKITAQELWRHIAQNLVANSGYQDFVHKDVIGYILEHGSLSTRIVQATGANPHEERVRVVYKRLAEVLAKGEVF